MNIEIDRAWRVRASASIEVPLPAAAVWGQMRDLRRFLTLDPLHAAVVVEPDPGASRTCRPGDRLIIRHRLLGLGPDRVGRVLKWDEGRGYAVSDLSRRGMRVGFPHVCTYRVEPAGPGRSRLTLGARGRWTARWAPRWVVRAWLWWVIRSTELCVARELRLYARWLASRGRATA